MARANVRWLRALLVVLLLLTGAADVGRAPGPAPAPIATAPEQAGPEAAPAAPGASRVTGREGAQPPSPNSPYGPDGCVMTSPEVRGGPRFAALVRERGACPPGTRVPTAGPRAPPRADGT